MTKKTKKNRCLDDVTPEEWNKASKEAMSKSAGRRLYHVLCKTYPVHSFQTLLSTTSESVARDFLLRAMSQDEKHNRGARYRIVVGPKDYGFNIILIEASSTPKPKEVKFRINNGKISVGILSEDWGYVYTDIPHHLVSAVFRQLEEVKAEYYYRRGVRQEPV